MGRCFYQDIAPTIRTRTDGANMDFIMEEVKIINPLKGQSDNGWHFEQQVYDAEGIARAVKAGEGSGNIPKVIEPIIYDDYNQKIPSDQSCIGTITTNIGNSAPRHGYKIIEPISVAMRGRNPDNPSERGKSNRNYKQRIEMNESGVANTITSVQKDSMVAEPMCSVHPNSHKFEFDPETSIKPISPALRATDYKAPHCVYEPRVEQVGNIYPDTDTFKNRTMGRVYSNEGLSPTINCCGGGDREPKVVETRYRIRKLTPRECFRLMGVADKDVDTLQSAGISNSQQYKLAGNSIVVDVLYHIFRKMFCEVENESDQLTLF